MNFDNKLFICATFLLALFLNISPSVVVGQTYQVTGKLQTENVNLFSGPHINEPIVGIEVKLYQDDTLLDSDITNQEGEFVLTHSAESGSLRIVVEETNALQGVIIEDNSQNPKKGFGIVINENNNWQEKLNELEISWHYSWGNQIPDNYPHDNYEYVPMVWGAWGDFSGIDVIVDRVNDWAEEGKVHYLLGFNEPDSEAQADLTVEEAIEAWPKLMNANVPLVSPAPVHANGEWLQDFMEQANALDYRVDYIGVHWYRGPNVNNFIAYLEDIYELYGLPIWLTEFGVADWSAGNIEDNRYSEQQVIDFMTEALPRLDDLDFVKRYAWFNSNQNHPPLTTSALFDADGNLTDLGLIYKNHNNEFSAGADHHVGNVSIPWKEGSILYNDVTYRTVIIGNQVWMAENLRTNRYSNGDPIPHITENSEWGELSTGAWSIHTEWGQDPPGEDHPKNFNRGKLYNWFAVNDERGLCPAGWAVPGDDDIKELEEALGMSPEDLDEMGGPWRGEDAGVSNALRATGGGGDFFWRGDNMDDVNSSIATNSSGFSMRGTSVRFPGGAFGQGGDDFSGLGEIGLLWASTENPENANQAIRRIIRSNQAGIRRNTVAKTAGHAVRCFKQDLGTSIGDSDTIGNEMPQELSLSQNYPNPFNPTTQINFEISQDSHVQLAVYDMLGRRVAVLVDEFRATGSYQVSWDASGFASGVYIYRLEAGGQFITNRMTLLK